LKGNKRYLEIVKDLEVAKEARVSYRSKSRNTVRLTIA
jgi:hypothetical protein